MKALIFGLILLTSCASAPQSPWDKISSDASIVEKNIDLLGSRFSVRIWKSKDRNTEAAFQIAFAELRRIALLTDSENSQSELSRINSRAPSGPVLISPELTALLAISAELNERSDGAFDITFAPLQEETEKLGPDAGIGGTDLEMGQGVTEARKERVGHRFWQLNEKLHQIRILKPGIRLVLNGVAKGYAIQKACEKLQSLKMRGFAILGDNQVIASGAALKDPNIMCIEDPIHLGKCLFRIRPSHPERPLAMAMAASADRPGHVYDTRKGDRVFMNGGATVFAPDGAWAQGTSVALSITSSTAAAKLLDPAGHPPIAAIVFGPDGKPAFRGAMTSFVQLVPASAH